jgi:putative tricarboxylic transport membrane protein
MLSRLNIPDLAFGLFLIAFGAIAFALAGDLKVGTADAMGPGYVPRGLALIIMAYGAAMGLRALFAGLQAFPEIELRPLLLICAAVAAFALLLPLAGLAVSGLVVVLVAGFAAHDVRLRENLILSIAVTAFSILLFVKLLGLPIPVWPGGR